MTTEILIGAISTINNDNTSMEMVNAAKEGNGGSCIRCDIPKTSEKYENKREMDCAHREGLIVEQNQQSFTLASSNCADFDGVCALSGEKNSPRQIRSPRCEAFVMTGEKMLSLNPKISPCYAKMCQNQLPPSVEVEDQFNLLLSPKNSEGGSGLDNLSALHRLSDRRRFHVDPVGAVHDSQSENLLDTKLMNAALSADGNCSHMQMHVQTVDDVQQQKVTIGTELSEDDTSVISDAIERFMAKQQSQSTPVTPVRTYHHNHPKQPLNHQQLQQLTTMQMMTSEAAEAKERESRNSHASPFPTRIGSFTSNRSSDLLITKASTTTSYAQETASRLAKHLFSHQEGLTIAAFLVKSDDFSLRIAREFVGLFNFAGLRVDIALRAFLAHVRLSGEINDRTQLLGHFARRYYECNPTVFNTSDEVHALTCALLLLNMEFHGKNTSCKKMSCRCFIDNLLHTDYKYDHAMLKELYASVKNQSIQDQPSDEHDHTIAIAGDIHKKLINHTQSSSSKKRAPKNNILSGIVDPEQQVDYKHGWLLKKSIYDKDGKRTPLGRRRWQMLYASIRGMVLYLHPNEHSFSSGRFITFHNCVLLHHSMAEPSREYTKRRNVFRLRIAQFGEMLFQTSDPTDVRRWCDVINYVAAAFSAPALPSPVGANGIVSFYKPQLPSSPTHLSISDQLQAHERRLDEIKADLARLRKRAPPMKARGKIVHDYFYKERYLEIESERYTVYISTLREKLALTSATIHNVDSICSNKETTFGKTMISSSSNDGTPNLEEAGDCSKIRHKIRGDELEGNQ